MTHAEAVQIYELINEAIERAKDAFNLLPDPNLNGHWLNAYEDLTEAIRILGYVKADLEDAVD